MPRHEPGTRIRLRPGVRVTRRGGGELQVGVHPDQRAVVTDAEPVRRLLAGLGHGLDSSQVEPHLRPVLTTLLDRGLVGPADEDVTRRRALEAARVAVVGADPLRAAAVRMLLSAGLGVADRSGVPTVGLHLSSGAEPRREQLDRAMRSGRAHLPVTFLAGRTRLGPFVAPGLTACVRCRDEHLTDRDPRHPLVLEQLHAPDPGDVSSAHDQQLALAWAVRDLVTWVDGERPSTWSATVELRPGSPRIERWQRHPRCGCAWGDALAG